MLKNELRRLMRTVKSADVGATRQAVCEFFYHMLNDPNKNLWTGLNKFGFDLKKALVRTFPNCLSEEELEDSYDVKQRIPLILYATRY